MEKMININSYITEKLRIGKSIRIDHDSYTYDEFVAYLKSYDITISEDMFEILSGDMWLGNMGDIYKLHFINITDNRDEMNYYKTQIAQYDEGEFNEYYVCNKHDKTPNRFFNYININYNVEDSTKASINERLQCFRYGLVIGPNKRDLDNIKLFSIKL